MFKTFPEFSKLTLADREEYESYIKDFPPVADISFVSMMTWWDGIGSADVSVLNGNLVISFWVPGDERKTGLALVGTNDTEASICTIFDHLRSKGEKPRLTNVPEFVVHSMRYPELFKFGSQYSEDEYIISLPRLCDLEQIPSFRRSRIQRFMKEYKNHDIKVRSLDLASKDNQAMLIRVSESWPKSGFNDLGSVETKVMNFCVNNAAEVGVGNLCLFIDDKVQAFYLYHRSLDGVYILSDHGRFNYDISNIFDYVAFSFSKHFLDSGSEFVNLHADMGFAKLRVFKLALRPSNFFRKYTIEPAKQDTQHIRNLDTSGISFDY